MDFTGWGGSIQDRERSDELKNAILTRHTIHFSYWGGDGKKSERNADPIKLLFKGTTGTSGLLPYAAGLPRVQAVPHPEPAGAGGHLDPYPAVPFRENAKVVMTPLHFTILKSRAYRVYDEFAGAQVTPLPGGNFDVRTCLPVDNWLVGYLLSFGGDLILHSPEPLRSPSGRSLKKPWPITPDFDAV